MAHLGAQYPNQPPPSANYETSFRGIGSLRDYQDRKALETAAAPKETAAQYSLRELQEVANRMEVVSNRLSAAKKRLQEHFGLPVKDSQLVDAANPVSESSEGLRSSLSRIDDRLRSVADGLEELV